MRHACLDLYQLGCESVLLKGGHLPRGPANDLFYDGSFRVFEGERLDKKVHGTGCMLSAFITALVAKGVPVADAVGLSKRFVTEAIRFSEPLGKGRSIGSPLTTLQNSAQRYHVLAEVFRWTGALEEVLPVALIPETGANLAFALPFAASVDDVCSLDGRLARAGKSARRVGFPAFGTPEPVASAVLAAMRSDRRVRSALNLRHSKPLLDLCRTLGLKIGEYDPAREPKDSASTVEWGAGFAVRALGFVPDIISGEGAHGREPMMLVLGEYPQQVVDKLGRIVTGLKER